MWKLGVRVRTQVVAVLSTRGPAGLTPRMVDGGPPPPAGLSAAVTEQLPLVPLPFLAAPPNTGSYFLKETTADTGDISRGKGPFAV